MLFNQLKPNNDYHPCIPLVLNGANIKKKSLINSKISAEVDSYLILMGDWSTTHNKHLELNSMATDDNHMNKPLAHFVKFEREQS